MKNNKNSRNSNKYKYGTPSGTESPEHKTGVSNSKEDKSGKPKEHPHPIRTIIKWFKNIFKMPQSHDKTIAIFTIVMGIFTIIVAIANCIMTWNVIDAKHIENRAFIQVRPDEKRGIFIDSATLLVSNCYLEIVNTGKTPAYNIQVYYGCAKQPIPLDTSKIKFMYIKNGGTMGANAISGFSGIPQNISVKYFLTLVTPLFVYGKIIYTDFFREKHFLHFYYRILPNEHFDSSSNERDIINAFIDKRNGGSVFQPMDTYNDAN